MPKCGSQCWMCDLPVRYDTYIGCSHGCKYCFVQAKTQDISNVKCGEGIDGLMKFISGARNRETKMFDWDIPLHIGGMSDPFQPIEKAERRTYRALQALEDANYPYVISTKGGLVADPEYLEIFDNSRAVIQISMACGLYDKLEAGCPNFEARLEIMRKIAPHTKRAIVRIQPYLHEAKSEIIKNIQKFADAGAYGIIVEGMKFKRKQKGLVKVGNDFCYHKELLQYDFEQIKDEAHGHGLVFLCGENRLRGMGDSLTCCGVDGLEGFMPNRFNLAHILNGDPQEPSPSMKETDTCQCFKAIYQDVDSTDRLHATTFADEMIYILNNKSSYVREVLGK